MVNDLSKAVINNIRNTVSNEINTIHETLVQQQERNQMPEDMFRDYFLPYFTNKVPISTQPAVITQWISIAGTPMSEIDVVDTVGTVLFTVPSLFDTTMINTAVRDVGDSIADISAEFDLRNNNIPSAAQTFLTNQLLRKSSKIDPTVNNQAQTRWNDIFKRYGILSTTGTTVKDESFIDDIEYD